MTKRRIAVLALASWMGIVGPSAGDEPAEEPSRVAMMALVEGYVTVERDEESQPARMMALLHHGDRVAVGADSRATMVLFAEGKRFRLTPGSEVEVTEDGVESVAGPEPEELTPLDAASLGVLRDPAATAGPGRGAGVVFRDPEETEPRLTLSRPLATRVPTARPVLEWEPAEGAARYRVTVSSLEGEELWTTTTPEVRVVYPGEAPPLEPGGLYFWDVRAFFEDGAPVVEGADFSILAAEERQLVDEVRANMEELSRESPDDPSPHIALALYYQSMELFDEAERELRALLEIHPREPLVRETLARLYEARGMSRQARELLED